MNNIEHDDILEPIISEIMKRVEEANKNGSTPTPEIVNTQRVSEFTEAYKILRSLAINFDGELTYKLHEPYINMGSISIVAKRAVFEGTDTFAKVGALATNFEAYPLTDGNVKLTFTFHNLTK